MDKRRLDTLEGLGHGYDEKQVRVTLNSTGTRIEAVTYVAAPSSIDDSLGPTAEYRNHVLAGAEEHLLPQDYVERFIRSIGTVLTGVTRQFGQRWQCR